MIRTSKQPTQISSHAVESGRGSEEVLRQTEAGALDPSDRHTTEAVTDRRERKGNRQVLA